MVDVCLIQTVDSLFSRRLNVRELRVQGFNERSLSKYTTFPCTRTHAHTCRPPTILYGVHLLRVIYYRDIVR